MVDSGMKISLHSNYSIFTEQQGYWTASKNIVDCLKELGHQVTYNDPSADLMFNFCMPHDYVSYPGQYTIGYTPWESTGMIGIHGGKQRPPATLAGFGIGYSDEARPNQTWPEMIMDTCDEFWTTNSLGYGWFKDAGVDLPGKVFPHGIDHDWSPIERHGSGPTTFLHVGEPAYRKGGQLVFEAFKELYGNNPDYKLIIKGHGSSLVRNWDAAGMIGPPDEYLKNVIVDIRDLPKNELISLYASVDCLVYPSWGEGFGFIPLQALATGLPVIMTTEWSDYAESPGVMKIKAELVESKWQDIHPGKMLEPSLESIKKRMQLFSKLRNPMQSYCYSNAQKVHDENDWMVLTEAAFKDVEAKLS